MTKEEETINDLLNKWSKANTLFWSIVTGMYFSFGGFFIFLALVPVYVYIIMFGVGVFLSLVRNRLPTKYHENCTINTIQKTLAKTLLLLIGLLVFLFILPHLGGSVVPELILVLIGIVFVITPLISFLDFHTDLGEAVLYFDQAINEHANIHWTKKGTEKLERYLRSLGISISSKDLFFTCASY